MSIPNNYLTEAQELLEYTRSFRRDFHKHPELGFQEIRTAGIVANELRNLGLEVSTGVGKTGVVALLESERPGSTILLRFDMDALPIQEETGVDYASETPGVMHACGHDGHTAIGLTVAKILQRHRADLIGTVKFIFQPAEEGAGGAESMISAGILQNPKPDLALALHLWNEKPVGWIGTSPGPMLAAIDIFKVHIKGRGGHGAMPNLALDPVAAAAQIVTALQTIVSRNVSPLQTAVVSVTTIHGGDAFNVIPSTVDLQGTIRTFNSEVRNRVFDRFQQITTGVAEAMGCRSEVELKSLAPATVNDPEAAKVVTRVAKSLFPEAEVEKAYMAMVSEDMAFVLERVPGCYFFVGSANPEKGLIATHHHPRFNFDEDAMPRAVSLMVATAVELMRGA